MNIQKVAFGGAYRVHCKNKVQAENIKTISKEHHLGYYQSKNGRKTNTLYVVTPDTMRDINSLTRCVLDASAPIPPVSEIYRERKKQIRENVEKQILQNAVDITL